MLNILPVLIFAACYFYSGILLATKALMGSTLILYLSELYLGCSKSKSEHFSTWLLVLMCMFTLSRNDPIYLVYKASLMYVLIPLCIFGYRILYQESIFLMLTEGTPIKASAYPWKRCEYTIGILNTIFAFLNLRIYFIFGESAWVQFKLYAMVIFMLTSFALLYDIQRHTSHESV